MSSDFKDFFKNLEEEQNKNLEKQKEVQKEYKKQNKDFYIPDEAPLENQIEKMGFSKPKEKTKAENKSEIKKPEVKSKPGLKISKSQPEEKKKTNSLKIKIGKKKPLVKKQDEPENQVVKPQLSGNNIASDEQKLDHLANLRFQHSETDIIFKDQWIKTFKDAINSKKEGEIVNKFRNGRFMITQDGATLLSDFDTSGKSTNDVFNGGPWGGRGI